GVGEGHLLHRETRWVGSRYFAKSESLFQSFPKLAQILMSIHVFHSVFTKGAGDGVHHYCHP
ncbi:hypothetical protein, partial [Pseudomonas lactis]